MHCKENPTSSIKKIAFKIELIAIRKYSEIVGIDSKVKEEVSSIVKILFQTSFNDATAAALLMTS